MTASNNARVLTIGSAQAKPGEKGTGFLHVGEMAMGMPVDIPVYLIHGVKAGPVLWLNGAVHGDELNGFAAIKQLTLDLNPHELCGSVVCTPLCNPLAVQWRNKINPWDFLDLDQQFPGKVDGQYSQRTAHVLFEAILSHATHLISFHTVGALFRAEPYTVYKVSSRMPKNTAEINEAMALTFGVRTNCRVDLDTASGEIPGGIGGSVDINCAMAGIPSFMAEIGHGSCFDSNAVDIAYKGVRQVMSYLGMISPEPRFLVQQRIITRRGFQYTDTAGFFTTTCTSGEILQKGQDMGRIFDLFSERQTVTAPDAAVLLMIRHDPVLHVGDRIAFLGYSWEQV